jgi:N-acetylmuramoyl-L-alanine amidase
MAALEALARDIVGRHPIPPHRVLGHSDVAPARKRDPGELFDWRRLAAAGIGLWPHASAPAPERPLAEVQALLARVGYEVAPSGTLDERTRLALTAFQRHFRPRRIDGRPDAETAALVAALCARLTAPPGAPT